MKLEIIFNLEGTDQYRVVCKYNHDLWLKHVWWGHLQRKITYKRWGFFGKEMEKWVEINSCWWDKSFETREELEQAAFKLYDENVLLYERLMENAEKVAK